MLGPAWGSSDPPSCGHNCPCSTQQAPALEGAFPLQPLPPLFQKTFIIYLDFYNAEKQTCPMQTHTILPLL